MRNFPYVSTLAFILFSLILGQPLRSSPIAIRYFSETSADMGRVRQGEILEHRFEFENSGLSAVTIGIRGLSPGMKARAPRQVLPGKKAAVTVSWDTQFIRDKEVGQVQLQINQSDLVSLTLSVEVTPSIDILPYPAIFISGYRDETVTRAVEIVNTEPAPFNILGLSGVGTMFDAEISTVEPGRRYRVEVKLKPGASAGQSQELLRVHTDNPRLAEIKVPVYVIVKDEVYANPSILDFGEVSGRTNGSESFLLRKRRGEITILSVTSDLPYLTITHTGDKTAPAHEFVVDLMPEALREGPIQGVISIKTDDPTFPDVKVRVVGNVQQRASVTPKVEKSQ